MLLLDGVFGRSPNSLFNPQQPTSKFGIDNTPTAVNLPVRSEYIRFLILASQANVLPDAPNGTPRSSFDMRAAAYGCGRCSDTCSRTFFGVRFWALRDYKSCSEELKSAGRPWSGDRTRAKQNDKGMTKLIPRSSAPRMNEERPLATLGGRPPKVVARNRHQRAEGARGTFQ